MSRVKMRLTVFLPEELAEKLNSIPWGLKGKVVSHLLEKALKENSVEELVMSVLKNTSSKSNSLNLKEVKDKDDDFLF